MVVPGSFGFGWRNDVPSFSLAGTIADPRSLDSDYLRLGRHARGVARSRALVAALAVCRSTANFCSDPDPAVVRDFRLGPAPYKNYRNLDAHLNRRITSALHARGLPPSPHYSTVFTYAERPCCL